MTEKEVFCPECACGHDAVKMVPRGISFNPMGLEKYDGFVCPTCDRQIIPDYCGRIEEVRRSKYDRQAEYDREAEYDRQEVSRSKYDRQAENEPVLKCANNHQPVEMVIVSFMDTAGLGTWYQCPSCLRRRFKTAEGIFNEGEGIMKINTVRYLEQQEELQEEQEEIERERENEETIKRRKQEKVEEKLRREKGKKEKEKREKREKEEFCARLLRIKEKREKEEFCARLLRNIELREKKEEQRKRRIKIMKKIVLWGLSLGVPIGLSFGLFYLMFLGGPDVLRVFAWLVGIFLFFWTFNNLRKEWKEWRANEKSQLEQANKRR